MSDLDNAVETTESPVDRKELLAQQFEAAEAESSPQRARDESGRFAPKEAAKEAVKAEPVEAAPEVKAEPEPLWKRPPASWKKDYHEPWNTVDDKVKEYVWQREEQMRKGVEPLLTKAQYADAMQEALAPYMNTIQGLGLKPEQAIGALAQADHVLRTSSPEQKVQYLMQLAQQYGINLNGAQQSAPMVDPNFYALQNELNSVRGEVLSWKQQQEAIQNQALLSEINSFAQGKEHFEEARPAMIQLLQSGMAETLDDAYEKAIRLDPGLFQAVNEAKQAAEAAKRSAELNRAAKNARAAAVSVRGSTPGTNTAPKAQDRRSMLAEQFDGMTERL